MRFNFWPVLRGHWKGLTRGDVTAYTPDRLSRHILKLPPLLAALALWRNWELAAPTPLLSAVALLAGALVGSFGSLSTLRLKLTDWADREGDNQQPQRDALDETVAHLLTAAVLCALTAAVLVIGTNVAGADKPVTRPWAALAVGLGSYVLLLFMLVVPRLYAAYVEINNVRDRLNGFSRGRF